MPPTLRTVDTTTQRVTYAPGARVEIRDEEWLVRRVVRTRDGGQALHVVGLSELVKDREAIFVDTLETSISKLDPAATKLVPDPSPMFQAGLLYIEAMLRQTPPTDGHLYVGYRAAMDTVPYQLEPALQALDQPRQRILIADAVGLGKTLEAGILLSELIKRGKGKRILVLTLKSMLTQFQKEMWSRFTIPLTRLDSIGIQRIRRRIPTNHNPFYYYDKAIISIDTLKQNAEYRVYLEQAYWDIIVIDEAQNVADRGTRSLRNRLATLLAERSDTLIMLSATPHDGKARSFASLMNMLDPTAIANPEDYRREDIKGLFIRRFKKDIQDQVASAFQERTIAVKRAQASPEEEAAYQAFSALSFTRLDQRRGGHRLFKTTLEKALFSSPAACLKTVQNRVHKLKDREDAEAFRDDIEALNDLGHLLAQITPEAFSKYQYLLELLWDKTSLYHWTGRDVADRLVIFTERIETLKFLQAHLPKDLRLKDKQVAILHGGLPDIKQDEIVQRFGQEGDPVRLLIASDVASEGINLHFLSHRMIHFDIPWSLMVFQQRNGRVDRYGQERKPQILYLMTEACNEKIRGDARILELLIQKDQQAVKNIGDPAALMGVYDIDLEEDITAQAMEQGQSAEAFEQSLEERTEIDSDASLDLLALLMGDEPAPTGATAVDHKRRMPSLFESDYAYVKAAMRHLGHQAGANLHFDDERQELTYTAPEDLRDRFAYLPVETWPKNGYFALSADRRAIQDEIKRCRSTETAWPSLQYLWEQHPIVTWLNDKVVTAFRRHEAPVIRIPGRLADDEAIVLAMGLIPNRKSQPVVVQWFGIHFRGGEVKMVIEDVNEIIRLTGLGRERIPNTGESFDTEALQVLIPEGVEWAKVWMSERRDDFNARMMPRLQEHLNNLQRLEGRKREQLELHLEEPGKRSSRKAKEDRRIGDLFNHYRRWIKDTMETEDEPYIQIVSVLSA